MTSAPSEFRRPLARYIAGVTLAHLMAATEVLLVMAALGHETHGAIGEMFAGHSAVIVSTVVVLAVLAIAVGAAWIFLPTLRWYGPGVEPTAAQRENTLAIPRRQTALLATVWVVSALPVLLANRGAAGPIGLMIIPPLVFGATAAILTALLLTVRTLRPMTAAALPDGAAADATHDTAPSVMARRLVDEMIEVAVPVVAAVNGPAVGLGCTVVTLCDIVFIAETAFLSDTHVAVALVAGDGGAVTWPAHTSLLRAKQYLLTGDRLAATEAVDLGLANFVVPGDRLIEEATAYAHRLAALPPQAVQETKALLNQHLRANAVRALGLGLAAEYQSHEQPEYREAGERLRPRDR